MGSLRMPVPSNLNKTRDSVVSLYENDTLTPVRVFGIPIVAMPSTVLSASSRSVSLREGQSSNSLPELRLHGQYHHDMQQHHE